MLDRQTLLAALAEAMRADPAVRAAWLGGSDATGRRDGWSDIDLVAVARPDAVERTFALIERTLEALSPIERRLRLPRPTWHGHEQAFYRLRDAGPHLLIDFVAMSADAPPEHRFLERERHGTPVVLFDHDAWITPTPFDREAHHRRMLARLDALETRFALFQTLVVRSIRRGQPVDAAHFYTGFTLAPTVEVLRMLHCPDRFDFGLRYLQADLPPDAYRRVERLALVPDLAGLAERQREAEGIFWHTAAAVRAGALPADTPPTR